MSTVIIGININPFNACLYNEDREKFIRCTMWLSLCALVIGLNFFFQAEDGIRDLTVTGVQTCALPISSSWSAKRRYSSPRTSTITNSWSGAARSIGE